MNRSIAFSRAAVRIGLACAAVFGTVAVGAAAPVELTIGANASPLALPLEVARVEGFLADEGLTVRVTDCATGLQCVQDMFDRRIEMVLTTDFALAMRTLERTDFAIVATIGSAAGNIRLIGRRSAGATSPQQLVGKRVGFLPGSSAQFYLGTMLLFYGIDPATITMVPLSPEMLETPFANGRLDAFAGYSRIVGRAATELGGDGVLLPEPRIYTETFNLAIERRTLIERRADVLKLLRALQRAELHIATHPVESKALLAARTRLSPAYVESIFPQYAYRLTLEPSLVSSLEAVVRWARSTGQVPAGTRAPNLTDILDSGPLKAAVPSAAPK